MLKRGLVTSFAVWAVALGAALQDAALHQAAAQNAPAGATILVRDAEKLSIRVYGYPELSGEYRVNADATISVPVLGRIDVSSASPADLERSVSKRVSEVTRRDASVTVEISAYVPVLVTGVVERSGAVPWQPGMTVLHAVALAGGMEAGTRQKGDAPQGSSRAQVRKALDAQARGMAVVARLAAERDGSTEIATPPRLAELVGAAAASRLVATQRTILLGRKSSQDTQVAALERAVALAKEELKGLETHQLRIADQLRVRRESRDRVKELQAKGLVRVDRAVEEDVRVADLEERAVNLSVSMTRIHASISGLERERVSLIEGQRAATEAEIGRLEAEISDAAIDVDEAPEGLWAANAMNGEPRTIVEYMLTRPRDNSTTAVDTATPLLPGDILVVRARRGRD